MTGGHGHCHHHDRHLLHNPHHRHLHPLQCGAAKALLSSVYASDPYVLMLACGCLQNLCFDPGWSQLVVAYEVHTRLEELLSHAEPMVVRYASGALTNVSALDDFQLSGTAAHAVDARLATAETEEATRARAAEVLAAAVRRIAPAARERRVASARRRLALALAADRRHPFSRPGSASSSGSSRSSISYKTANSYYSTMSGSNASSAGGGGSSAEGGGGPSLLPPTARSRRGSAATLSSLTGVGLGAVGLQEL